MRNLREFIPSDFPPPSRCIGVARKLTGILRLFEWMIFTVGILLTHVGIVQSEKMVSELKRMRSITLVEGR